MRRPRRRYGLRGAARVSGVRPGFHDERFDIWVVFPNASAAPRDHLTRPPSAAN